MVKPLSVLFVEDSEDDALLMIRELVKGGYEPGYERVETEEAMRAAFRQKHWDMILCDYQMPQLNGLAAITLLKEACIDTPLIIVSGAIGEELAVECMRMGARDYIMKDNLHRLAPVVERELKEAESRRQCKRVEQRFQEQYTLLTSMINSPKDIIIFSVDRNYRYTAFNEKHREEMKKIWNADIATGTNLLEYMHQPKLKEIAKLSIDRALGGESFFETQHQPERDIYYEFNWDPIIQAKDVIGVTVFIRDITEKKRAEETLNKMQRLLAETARMGKVGGWEFNIDSGHGPKRSIISTKWIYLTIRRWKKGSIFMHPHRDQSLKGPFSRLSRMASPLTWNWK
jgi:PAS domain S-box-containing protein